MRQTVPLAELHSRLWETITADDYLDVVLDTVGPREWGAYRIRMSGYMDLDLM